MKVIPETCAPNLISTFSLDLPHFSEMPASNQKYEQSCICELGVSSLPVSMIFYWDFAIVPTMVFFHLFYNMNNQLTNFLDHWMYICM
jgi:hypothetical protein